MSEKETKVEKKPKSEKKSPKSDKKKKFISFWRGFFAEFKKIVWPAPIVVLKNTLRVLAIMGICFVVIAALDYAFTGGIVALTDLILS